MTEIIAEEPFVKSLTSSFFLGSESGFLNRGESPKGE